MNCSIARKALSAVLISAAFWPAVSWAVPISILFQGESMTVLDKRFSNFRLIDIQTVNGGFANFSQVDVTPLADDPRNPGLKFTVPFDGIGTPFGHDGLSSVTAIFEFDVATTSGLPLIKDNSLWISDWAFDAGPNAFIQITELVSDASGAPLGDKLAIVYNGDSAGDPDHFDAAEFAPQAFVHVRKTINVVGPGTNDGARLLMFEQRFSQVPEPTSLALVATVLCGIATFTRGRRA